MKDLNNIFIRRIRKRAKYTNIDNYLINDFSIPLMAFRVLVYVMSKPEDWKISVPELSEKLKKNPRTVYRAITSLINKGYMHRTIYRDKKGRISGYSLEASDSPEFLDNPGPSPVDISLHVDFTTCGSNVTIVNNDLVTKERNNNKQAVSELSKNVVVVLESLNIEKSGYEQIAEFEEKHILEQTQNMKGKKLTNPTGFLIKALKNNWKLHQEPKAISPYPSIEESKLINLPPEGPRTLDPKKQISKARAALKSA